MEEQQVISEFLGERPRADELREWRSLIGGRIRQLETALQREPNARLERELRGLRQQVAALQREEAITGFVEDSVKVTLRLGAVTDEDPDDLPPEGW